MELFYKKNKKNDKIKISMALYVYYDNLSTVNALKI